MIMEQYRYFAEECDYLSSIVITADIYNGFGGILTSILEEIRQDEPHLLIPIFAISAAPKVVENQLAINQMSHISSKNQTKNSTLISLNLPLCYAKMHECSDMVIPIHPPSILSQFNFTSTFDSFFNKAIMTSNNLNTHLVNNGIANNIPYPTSLAMNIFNTSAVAAATLHTLFSPMVKGYKHDYAIYKATAALDLRMDHISEHWWQSCRTFDS